MRLTYGQIHQAFRGANMIVGRKAEIPSMAKFKIARIHDALEPLFKKIEAYRLELVHKHGKEQFADPEQKISTGWGIEQGSPEFAQFEKDWEEFCTQTEEVSVTPASVAMLGNSEKGLEALEFKLLGPLVTEPTDILDRP